MTGGLVNKLIATFTRWFRHRPQAGDVYEGTNDHISYDPTIATASDADVGGPRRENHLIGMRDRVG